MYLVLALAAFLTAFYVGRQLLLVFFGKGRTTAAEHAKESPALVTVPLVLLAILTVLGGALNLPGSHLLETWLEHTFGPGHAGEFIVTIAVISTVVALVGLLIAWSIYGQRKTLAKTGSVDPLAHLLGPVFKGMENKWWVDEFYHFLIVRPYEAVARFSAGAVDQGLIDGIVNGFGTLVALLASWWRRLQNGYVRSYALMIFLGVVAILTYLVFFSR